MFYTQGIPPISRRIAGGLYRNPPFNTASWDVDLPLMGSAPRGVQTGGSIWYFYRNLKPITDTHWDSIYLIWDEWDGYTFEGHLDISEFFTGAQFTSEKCFVDGDPAKGMVPFQKNYASADWPMNWVGTKAWFPQLCAHQVIMRTDVEAGGSGYTNGTGDAYDNLSTTTETGSGSGLKVNVKVEGGAVTGVCPNVYDIGTFYSSSYGSGDSTSSYGGGGYSMGDTGTINGIPGGGSGAKYKIGGSSWAGGTTKTLEICSFRSNFEPAQKRSTETLADYGVNIPGQWWS